MAKLKKPLLSLAARGTVADTLTFQKRQGIDLVKKKPVPSQPRTLPQMYQRWQYQDYVSYWHTLPQSTKDFYRSQGSRCHLSGFAYFMKSRLSDLSDLVLRSHLDETSGAVATDSSKNENPGTIIGASPVDGVIAGGYHFDGLNDRIVFNSPASICPTTAFSFTLFMRLTNDRVAGVSPNMQMMAKQGCVRFSWEGNSSYLWLNAILDVGSTFFQTNKDSWNGGQDYAIGFTYDGTHGIFYVDGVEDREELHAGVLVPNANVLQLGAMITDYWYAGDLDEFVWYNRCLTASDVLRLSERRYPL